jgi:hypothetical protein
MLRHVVLAGVVVCAGGCTERPAGFEDDSSSSAADAETGSPTSGMPGSTSPVVESSGGVDIDTSGSTGSSSSEDGTFDDGWPCGAPGSDERLTHCTPDGGGVTFECDVIAQDCPLGEKCMPWANDGGNAWNATRCSPVAENPGQPGDECTVDGTGVSGVDDCDLGSMCWNVDPETNIGTCVSMCSGDEASPVCEDPGTACVNVNDGAIVLCLPSCDPLLQDCPEGQACYGIDDAFSCVPDASGELGLYGDACEFINVCDPGLFCASAEAVPSCTGSLGCCSEFCDLGNEAGNAQCSGAAGGQECVAWSEDPLPGFEAVGACVIPA